MQKYILTALIFIGLCLTVFGQAKPISKIQIKGTLVACSEIETLYLYQWQGTEMREIASQKLTEKKGVFNFTFKLNPAQSGFYAIGKDAENTKPIILGTEAKVTLTGSCENFKQLQITNSEVNTYFGELVLENKAINTEFQKLIKKMRGAMRNPALKAELEAEFAKLDERRITTYENAKTQSPFMGKSQALVTYLSFTHNQGDYPNEAQYFANEYFSLVDFTDPDLQYTPALLQQMQPYAATLAQVGIPHDEQAKFIDDILTKTSPNPFAYKAALFGAVLGFSKAKDKTNFVKYAKVFLEKYPDADPALIANISQQIKRASSMIIGAEAPDIIQKTPDGTTAKLSELRGKVVLIDFWASWCGPCRRDNPKVVAIYNKYKAQGFEVFGVSLDSNKARWEAAIAKDKLTWTHVSDLQKWKSAAAQDYGVRSIPTTILIDQDGKIVGKNLKGAALEKKIQETLSR